MTNHYAIAKLPENYAKAMGKDLPISTKHSAEICRYLRGRNLQKAKKMLEEVIAMKRPVPFKKYTRDVGHKPGIASGRYPIKAAQAILILLNDVEANAQVKGLSSNDLIIHHFCAHLASRPWHYGRISRRKMKRTHVEIVVTESKQETKKTKASKKKAAKETTVASPVATTSEKKTENTKATKPSAKSSTSEVSQ